VDGYSPGPGNTNGPWHVSDYRSDYWRIDATEASRVLAYWRAGGYRIDPEGLDGYAPLISPRPAGPNLANSPQVMHQWFGATQAGGLLDIQATIHHSGYLLSLLARPELPANWTITKVSGDGAPQVLGHEILFIDQNLPNPVTFQYQVQIPATAQGTYPLRTPIEYQTAGMVNPVTVYAAADPLSVTVESSNTATTLITYYYASILGRNPDAEGLAHWQQLIADRQAAGADVKPVFRDMANFFFNSPEYLGNATSDTQFLTDLYRTFFQREPDADGLAFWLGQLAAGVSRNEVMAGFLYAPEFTAFMEALGF
jgi:hypothetical protein